MRDRRWDKAPGTRHQILLFAQSLDEVVPQDHVVRQLDAVLDQIDWAPWEARYAGLRGRPPLHPRAMASAIVYGMLRKVRSSRELEAATRERVDFLWLLEGRAIDHATFAAFRVAFSEELKDLHRQVARLICALVEGTLVTLVIDGTRERANSNRHGARTREALEGLIARCTEELDRRLARLAEHDEQGETADDATPEAAALRREVATLQARVAQLEKAAQVAQARDARKRRFSGAGSTAVRVPVTDPDAQLVPNKEGGFAPNYTPTVAVDPVTRMIVAADVLAGSEEHAAVLPAVEAAEALGGHRPERVVADSGFAAGETLARLEACGVEAYMPTNTDFRATNPAQRADPTQPVPKDQWDRLPRRNQKLASSAFVYDDTQDCHHCPMGKTLVRTGQFKQWRTGLVSVEYTCADCAGCPLMKQCLSDKATARTVTRDIYQEVRDRVGRRMATAEGQARYQTRAPVVEGVFAEIKHVLGIRRFLLRGLEKVRTEWNWVCVSFNLKRLLALRKPVVERPKRPRPVGPGRGSVQEELGELVEPLYRPFWVHRYPACAVAAA